MLSKCLCVSTPNKSRISQMFPRDTARPCPSHVCVKANRSNRSTPAIRIFHFRTGFSLAMRPMRERLTPEVQVSQCCISISSVLRLILLTRRACEYGSGITGPKKTIDLLRLLGSCNFERDSALQYHSA